MTDRTLDLARRLHALARTGLHFCGNEYDRERYEEIERIAAELLSGPSPADRDPKVGFRPGTDEEASFKNNDDAPFSAFVFKSIADKYTGQLSVMRIFSGQLHYFSNYC